VWLFDRDMTLVGGDMVPGRRICDRNPPYITAFHSLSAAYPQADYAGFASPHDLLAAHKPTGQLCQPPAWSNTVRQASLKLDRLRRRQAVMARTLGISPAQSR